MKPIILTYGMGIGAEVALKALLQYQPDHPIVLLGREAPLRQAARELRLDLQNFKCIFCTDESEAAEVAAIRSAAQQCLEGTAAAMVTGPIHKEKLVAKGFAFSGHTDFLGDICAVPETVMSFVGGDIAVCLMTTHIPLMAVAENLSIEKIVRMMRIAHNSFLADLGMRAHFAVCGLNPHAGEGGVLGQEEIDIIAPACDILRQEGIKITGPVSSETAFVSAREGLFDVVVAMYHDQGLAPLKLYDFGRSVNWTLGLPIIRTSVDHGTADHLVGTLQARPESMIAALQLAERLARKRA